MDLRRQTRVLGTLAAFALLLTACGGGGGGDAATPAPQTGPVVGSATLNWSAPTQNSDGSALTNLAGYHIVYGTAADALTNTVQISGASLVTHTISNLAAGTWYFAIKAYTNVGDESVLTGVVSKTI